MLSCVRCQKPTASFPVKSRTCRECRNEVAREKRVRKGTICFRCHQEKQRMASKKICLDCWEKKITHRQVCTLCKIEKDVSDFYKRGRHNLYRTQCKECEKGKKERSLVIVDQSRLAYKLGEFFAQRWSGEKQSKDLAMVSIVHIYTQNKHHFHIMGLPVILSDKERDAFFRGYYEASAYKECFMRIFFTQQESFLLALQQFLQQKKPLVVKEMLRYLYSHPMIEMEPEKSREDRRLLEGQEEYRSSRIDIEHIIL